MEISVRGLMPHMHVRGKACRYELISPDGKTTTMLMDIPRYDFNWQLTYIPAQPKKLPRGTTLEIIAHYDNSPNNRFNPDPSKEVKWGDQSWEEMFAGFMELSLNLNQDPDAIFEKAKKPPVQTAANR